MLDRLRRGPNPAQKLDLASTIAMLNKERINDRLYVSLLEQNPEAMVQDKYRKILDNEARERERLAGQIRARTKELLDTNQLLLKVQKELIAYKKGVAL